MLRAERLAAQRGGVTLFANVEFALDCGEALIVTGANGSGKTTLLRIVAGLPQPPTWQPSLGGAPPPPVGQARRGPHLPIGHRRGLPKHLTAPEEHLFPLPLLP